MFLIKIGGDFPIIEARYRVGPIAAVPCTYSLGLCDYIKQFSKLYNIFFHLSVIKLLISPMTRQLFQFLIVSSLYIHRNMYTILSFFQLKGNNQHHACLIQSTCSQLCVESHCNLGSSIWPYHSN